MVQIAHHNASIFLLSRHPHAISKVNREVKMQNKVAREVQLKSVRRIVKSKAYTIFRRGSYNKDEQKDIEQELYRALIEQQHHFDPAKANFVTFAVHVIDRKAAKILRDRHAKQRDPSVLVASMDEPIGSDEDGQSLHEVITQDDFNSRMFGRESTQQERAEMRFDVAEILQKLPPELKEVAILLQSHSLTEISRKLHIPYRTLRGRYMQNIRAVFEAKNMRVYLM